MLGLIYIFSTAKPVSIRRLSLLFVSVLVLARLALGVLQIGQALSIAMYAAEALTAGVWITPLLRSFCATLRSGRPAPHALNSASGAVQCSYGLALVMLALFALQSFFSPTHAVTLSGLSRMIVVALLVGVGLSAVLRLRKGPMRTDDRVAQPHSIVRAR